MESVKSENRIVFGWMIWEFKPNRFIEAEFHSVMEIQGKLVDITPRVDAEKLILFVEDPSRKPIRTDERTWSTFTNIKSQNGKIFEEPKRIQIRDAGYGN
jgi:hypothetical protein